MRKSKAQFNFEDIAKTLADRRSNYGYKDDKRGTQVALDIVGVFDNEYEVREMCSDLLAPYQMPSKINILKELPKNSFGKVDRRRQND